MAAEDLENLLIFLRYILQAYTQTTEDMKIVVYFCSPAFFGFNQLILVRIEEELYGMPEAGFLWLNTYHNHYTNRLKPTPAFHGKCLLFTPGILATPRAQIFGASFLQTGDTTNVGTESFKVLDAKNAKHFKTLRPKL